MEERLVNPSVVLAKLKPTTEVVMRGCVELINGSKTASELGIDTEAVARCHVHPGAFFGACGVMPCRTPYY